MQSYQQYKSLSPQQHIIYNSSDGSSSETDQNNNYEEDVGLKNRKGCFETGLTDSDDTRIEDQRDFINNLARHVIYGSLSTQLMMVVLLSKHVCIGIRPISYLLQTESKTFV
jgi:hypothetical protein